MSRSPLSSSDTVATRRRKAHGMAETRRRFGLALAVMLLAGALALPFVGGYPLAYALAIVSLLLIAWWLLARPRPAEMAEPTSIIMALAVLLVAVALAATAK